MRSRSVGGAERAVGYGYDAVGNRATPESLRLHSTSRQEGAGGRQASKSVESDSEPVLFRYSQSHFLDHENSRPIKSLA